MSDLLILIDPKFHSRHNRPACIKFNNHLEEIKTTEGFIQVIEDIVPEIRESDVPVVVTRGVPSGIIVRENSAAHHATIHAASDCGWTSSARRLVDSDNP